MRATLEQSLQSLQQERGLIARLDAAGIMRSVQDRQVRKTKLERSTRAFSIAIASARAEAGASEEGLGGLLVFAPTEVARVRSVLEEVTHLAAQVKAEEEVQSGLLARARACVSGFIGAMTPTTMAYDARGIARAARARGRTRQVVV
jgi:hypothetical protein